MNCLILIKRILEHTKNILIYRRILTKYVELSNRRFNISVLVEIIWGCCND